MEVGAATPSAGNDVAARKLRKADRNRSALRKFATNHQKIATIGIAGMQAEGVRLRARFVGIKFQSFQAKA